MVVSAGDTILLPDSKTLPMLWSMEIEVAPLTFHSRVELSLTVIVLGVAVKLSITGKPEAATVMVIDLVASPSAFLARRPLSYSGWTTLS